MPETNGNEKTTFVGKVWIVGGVFSLLAVLLLLFKFTIHIFILILAGVLVACYFLGVAKLLRKKTKLSQPLALSISITGTTLFVLALFFLIGTSIVAQVEELTQAFPELLRKTTDLLNQGAIGKKIIYWIENLNEPGKMDSFLSGFFQSSFGLIGDLYIIFFVSLYFTVTPNLYRKGLIAMVPPRGRKKAVEVLDRLSYALTRWLFGKFLAMFIVFVVTAIALAVVQVPLWLTLAFIAGLSIFVPNFGPLLAAIPAVLVGFSESMQTGIIVGILYLIIQATDGNFITPKIQSRLVKIPPALIILGQVFMGVTLGVWGLVYATPIVLVIMILVEELYLNSINNHDKILSKTDIKT